VSVDGSGLLLELCQVVGVVGQVGEDHSLFIVVLAQDLVVTQEEPVADAKPVTKTKQVLKMHSNLNLYTAFNVNGGPMSMFTVYRFP
jgi:hypothetical protein